MAKKLLIGLLATAVLLIGVNVFAATPQKLNMEYTGEPPGEGIGWTVTFGENCAAPWHSIWYGYQCKGLMQANKYDMVAPIDIYSIQGWFYNHPGVPFIPGVEVIFHVWDDAAGLPGTSVYATATPIVVPGDAGWQVMTDENGTLTHLDAGTYYFGYEFTGEDTAVTQTTADTGCWAAPHGVSFVYYPGDMWYNLTDFGFPADNFQWDIFVTGEYTECVDEMAIPDSVFGPPGATVNVPVYGLACGGSPDVNMDGFTIPFHYDTTYFECIGAVADDITDPMGAGYTTFDDVIDFSNWDKFAVVVDSTGGAPNGDAWVVGVFKFAGTPDVPPGTYHMVNVQFNVDLATPVDHLYPVDFAYGVGIPPKYPGYTYGTQDVRAIGIDGTIFVPSHVMFGVTFSPDPAAVDENECILVDVSGGCTVPTDVHDLNVVDWGGADAFGDFWQLLGTQAAGKLEFCPGFCDAGVYYITVEDHCLNTGLKEYGTLQLTVTDKGDKIHLVEFDPETGEVVFPPEPIKAFPGGDVCVAIYLECAPDDIGGYNFLLHFDNTMLDLVDVYDLYESGPVEYFWWDEFQVDDGNKVRIVGIANKPNQMDTPAIDSDYGAIVALCFHVSAKWDCNYWLPIDFEVDDPCVDNTLSSEFGDELYTTQLIYSYRFMQGEYDDPTEIWVDTCWSTYCDYPRPHPGWMVLDGIVIECEHIYGPYGDINMDLIRYTIADAVYFMEYLKGKHDPLPDPDYQGTASDINRDGHQWTIADLIYLVNIINDTADPPGGEHYPKVLASSADIAVRGNTVSTNAEIGGIYLTVKGGGEPILNAAGMDMETSAVNGERRIIIMSWDSNTATGDLVTIPGSFEITSVEVSDPAGYLMKVSTVPGAFALAQNYPNPFNPNTNIAFSLPNDANVSLTVYNIAGEKVAELVNGQVKAGHHTVTWNATDVASGVYFYTIKAGNFTATRKMVLMK